MVNVLKQNPRKFLRNSGTMYMISTAEFLGRARVIDVCRGQNCAIFLVISHVAVLVSIADLVPLDAFGRILAKVPSTHFSSAPNSSSSPAGQSLFPSHNSPSLMQCNSWGALTHSNSFLPQNIAFSFLMFQDAKINFASPNGTSLFFR